MPADCDTGGRVVVTVCLGVVLALGLVALGSTGALATHEEETTTDGFKAYTPGGEIPNPGDVMSVELYQTPAYMGNEGPIPSDVEIRVEYKAYYTTTLSDCDTEDVFVLGIDRGNNNTGTEADEDMLQSLMDNGDNIQSPADDPMPMTTNDEWDHRQVTWLEFPDEDDFIEPLFLHQGGIEDQSIVGTSDCVEMPDAGWHRTVGMLNGTITNFKGDRGSVEINGETLQEGDHFEIWEPSLWYPVCDCEQSRQVAMELSPPPGEMTRGSEGGLIHPNGTIEAPYAEINEDGWILYDDIEIAPEEVTAQGINYPNGFIDFDEFGPMYFSEGHIEADGTIVTPSGDRIKPNEGGGPTPTPDRNTPTPTPTPTPDDTGADTPTPDDTGADTSTPTPDDTEADTPTPTPTPDDGGDGDEEPMTPAAGDGPGFGPVVALLALLVSAALTRRYE